MRGKIVLTFLSLFLFSVFCGTIFSQKICDGGKIFSEKNCSGDEISQQEKELHQIVNEYRAKNNLPKIPLSDSLSIVANRHLLDLAKNLKSLTHGWSNCPFDLKNQNTWNCVFESPKRLNVGYSGNGYENLYRNLEGNATPVLALEAWKKSEMHNSLLLNLNNWKDTQFDAFGMAVSGEYIALWFGSKASNSNNLNESKNQGLGVTFEKAVANLSNVVSIKKTSSISGKDEWIGVSADKSVMLAVSGTKEDVSEATISIKIKLEKNSGLSQKNKNVLMTFLNNLAFEWNGREVWVEASLKKLGQNSKSPQTINQGNKTISMSVGADNYLSITVKPFRKIAAIEVK